MIPNQTEVQPVRREDYLLLAETLYLLFLYRLQVLILPFRWVMRAGGVQHAVSPNSIPVEKEPAVEKVAWAIEAVRWATPWDSNCLARALAGKRMLRRRKVDCTLYLGVRKSDPRSLEAHAWLRCGEKIITGVAGHEDFIVVATFA